MYQLHVPDMSCQHCVKTITSTLQALDPKVEVSTDLDAKTVGIDGNISVAQAQLALSEAGYPASNI